MRFGLMRLLVGTRCARATKKLLAPQKVEHGVAHIHSFVQIQPFGVVLDRRIIYVSAFINYWIIARFKVQVFIA